MVKNIVYIIRVIISMPRTIIYNFILFKSKYAIFLPVYFDINVRVKGLYRGAIEIDYKNIKMFSIKFGIGGSNAINSRRGRIFINKKLKSKIIFKGIAKFSDGIILYVNGGILTFGNNFSCNKNCFISCDYNIEFGNDVLLGWNISARDSDGHIIEYKNMKKKNHNIKIGNHCWICAEAHILKNNYIGNNCVIGYKSLVTNLNSENNCLITGHPAKVIRNDITWRKD